MNNTATCKYVKNCLRHFPYVKKGFRKQTTLQGYCSYEKSFCRTMLTNGAWCGEGGLGRWDPRT